MVKLALVGAPIEATGHPGACGSTVSGTVSGSSSISVNGTDIAIGSDCSLSFGSHGHSTDEDGNCTNKYSHEIEQSAVSSTLSVDGKPVWVSESGVATDPGSGGNVNYVSSGGNTSVDSHSTS